jgi:hypothetical protein
VNEWFISTKRDVFDPQGSNFRDSKATDCREPKDDAVQDGILASLGSAMNVGQYAFNFAFGKHLESVDFPANH